jgi:hypothetical protein
MPSGRHVMPGGVEAQRALHPQPLICWLRCGEMNDESAPPAGLFVRVHSAAWRLAATSRLRASAGGTPSASAARCARGLRSAKKEKEMHLNQKTGLRSAASSRRETEQSSG